MPDSGGRDHLVNGPSANAQCIRDRAGVSVLRRSSSLYERTRRVDLTRSPRRRGTTAICAELTAGVDVKGSFRVAAVEVAVWRRSRHRLERIDPDRLGVVLEHDGAEVADREILTALAPARRSPSRDRLSRSPHLATHCLKSVTIFPMTKRRERGYCPPNLGRLLDRHKTSSGLVI